MNQKESNFMNPVTKKILMIEDDPNIVELARIHIRRSGIRL